jgi:hypothetical protein
MEQALEPNHFSPARSSRAGTQPVTLSHAPRYARLAIPHEDLLLQSGHADAFETLESMALSRPRQLLELFLELWGEPPSSLALHEIGPLDGSARLVLTHAQPGDACWERVGFLQRGLELLGAKTFLVSEVECRSDGADACVYECEWSRFA